MNKRVFVSMLSLTIFCLCFLYIAKIFFPEQFVMVIQNERLCSVGRFIDSQKWLYYICCGITSFVTYWLFCTAVSHRKFLNWKECLIIVAGIVLCRLMGFIDPNFATHINISLFFVLPAFTKGRLKDCAIVYSVHGFAQILSLFIRGLPMYLTTSNFLTIMFMTFEMYIWLVLFYVIYNYKENEKEKE